jgi:alkylation response protein AidB-like acyl-CoA dehydrogenase
MEFSHPEALDQDLERFAHFYDQHLKADAAGWYREGQLPKSFFRLMGVNGWFGFEMEQGRIVKRSAVREAALTEKLASYYPGLAVAALASMDLGCMGLYLFGSADLQAIYGPAVTTGEKVMCLGNTENIAGSDVAGITLTATPVDGGWLLNGTKAYVTNGYLADLGIITAVSDPDAPRSRRLSMFLVDLTLPGVERTSLDKQVWIPSDLTRLQFKNVRVSSHHLLGERSRGLLQVLNIFTHSRVPISALTLGTAWGAFEKAIDHARKRVVFGRKLLSLQVKAFEAADFYARMEAGRLMIGKACRRMDEGRDFRLEASMAKYLAVDIARQVTTWAADLFGAASVVYGHPIHKFPMDAWASALGEGTQDVQKLVIFREMIRRQFGTQPDL